jgi:hypothetical protein
MEMLSLNARGKPKNNAKTRPNLKADDCGRAQRTATEPGFGEVSTLTVNK